MTKFLLTILLVLVSIGAEAKAVANLVESSGSIILYDDPCKIPEIGSGYHLQGFNPQNKKTFSGCWIEQGDVLYLISSTGAKVMAPKEAFNWNSGI